MNEELLYNEIYEKTKDCGRTQFDRLLMDKERENKQLKAQLQQKEDNINKARDKIQEIAYGGNEDYYMEKIKSVLKILDNKG